MPVPPMRSVTRGGLPQPSTLVEEGLMERSSIKRLDEVATAVASAQWRAALLLLAIGDSTSGPFHTVELGRQTVISHEGSNHLGRSNTS